MCGTNRDHAILEYLHARHFEDTADALRTEARLAEPECPPGETPATVAAALPFTALEQRWLCVVALQARVADLEERVKALQVQVRLGGGSTAPASAASEAAATAAAAAGTAPRADESGAAAGADDEGRAYLRFPHAPERCTLVGHRAAVTSLAFHPAFTFVIRLSLSLSSLCLMTKQTNAMQTTGERLRGRHAARVGLRDGRVRGDAARAHERGHVRRVCAARRRHRAARVRVHRHHHQDLAAHQQHNQQHKQHR